MENDLKKEKMGTPIWFLGVLISIINLGSSFILKLIVPFFELGGVTPGWISLWSNLLWLALLFSMVTTVLFIGQKNFTSRFLNLLFLINVIILFVFIFWWNM